MAPEKLRFCTVCHDTLPEGLIHAHEVIDEMNPAVIFERHVKELREMFAYSLAHTRKENHMTEKKPTIIIERTRGIRSEIFEVVRVEGTMKVLPGDDLTRERVNELITSGKFRVVIDKPRKGTR